MSLDWDISGIKDNDRLCWTPPVPGEPDGSRAMTPLTHSIIMATMAVCMGEITAKNCDEFFIRLDTYQRAVGPFMHKCTDELPPNHALIAAAEMLIENGSIQATSGSLVDDLRKAVNIAKEPRVIDVLISYEQVVAHIGLTTNVSNKNRAAFAKEIGLRLLRSRESSLHWHKERTEKGKANEQTVS